MFPEPKVVSVTADYTVVYGNHILLVDSSGGVITITVPRIGSGAGRAHTGYHLFIKDVGFAANTNNITIIPTATDKIDNGTSLVINDNGGFLDLEADATSMNFNWLNGGDNNTRRPNTVFSIPFANTIDGKTTGAVNIFKVPQGKKAVFLGADIAIKAKTGMVTGVGAGKVQVAGGSDLSASASFTGFSAVGDVTHFSPLAAGSAAGVVVVGGAGGTWVQFNLTTAFTVTTMTLDGSVQGYMLN